MKQQLKAPEPYSPREVSVFLAGSIEQGKAVQWQQRVVDAFSEDDPITFLNPRRDDWDASWVQDISCEQFREQVEWELAMMEHADYIFMYFDPETLSPISLLEFGMFANAKDKLVAVCPEGFWRRGNIQVVSAWTDCPLLLDTLEEGITALRYIILDEVPE